MTIREEFEEWASNNGYIGYLKRKKDESYFYSMTVRAWDVWQAQQKEIDVLKAEIERLKSTDDEPVAYRIHSTKTASSRIETPHDAEIWTGFDSWKKGDPLYTRPAPVQQNVEPTRDDILELWPIAMRETDDGLDAMLHLARALLSRYGNQQTQTDHIADPSKMVLPPDVIHCLRFYGNGEHFYIDPDGEGFDTVSGEPENWLHNQADGDQTMIENGELARAVLRGEMIKGNPESQPVEGEVYGIDQYQCERQLNIGRRCSHE